MRPGDQHSPIGGEPAAGNDVGVAGQRPSFSLARGVPQDVSAGVHRVSAGAMPTAAPPLNPIQLAHAYAVCRGIARRAAKNFYFSFLVLPKEKRNAICALTKVIAERT